MAVNKIPDYERLERWYTKWSTEYKCGTSGILWHLRTLSSECTKVVELGVKKGVSSVALILGCNNKVISYDIATNDSIKFLQKFAGKLWKFIRADSRTIEVPPCDMVFFDSLHTYEQLKEELRLHGHKAGKYLVFHDTITFGIQGADGETGQFIPGYKQGEWKSSVAGIRMAIDEFMIANRDWYIKEHHKQSNGLLVLQRANRKWPFRR